LEPIRLQNLVTATFLDQDIKKAMLPLNHKPSKDQITFNAVDKEAPLSQGLDLESRNTLKNSLVVLTALSNRSN